MSIRNNSVRFAMLGIMVISACSMVGARVPQLHLVTSDSILLNSTNILPSDTTLSNTVFEISTSSSMEVDIFNLINAYRREKKLPALIWDNNVAIAAARHSRNMADKKTPFGHPNFEQRMKAIKVPKVTLIGWSENVASGQLTAKEVVNGWLASPGHRKNIIGMYHYTGIGVAKNSRGKLYFTQIFVRIAGK